MGMIYLAVSNIRKRKNEVVSFGILIIIAALLMNIGLNLLLKVGAFYDKKAAEYNIPSYLAIINNNDYKEEYLNFLKNDSRVKDVEIEETIYMRVATFLYNNSEIDLGIQFLNADDNKRTMFPLKVKEGEDDTSGEGIYLPICLKNNNCKLNDEYSIKYKNEEFKFKIAGFFEAPVMGNLNCGSLRYYLRDKSYKKLYKEIGGSQCISVILNNLDDIVNLQNDFKNETDIKIDSIGSFSGSYDLNIKGAKQTLTYMFTIVGTIIILFSIFIEIIVLVVIKFRVENDINNNMENIGCLGAIGYTSKQIILSMIFEYLIITVGTAVIGVGISYMVMGLISGVLTKLIGMIWTTDFNLTYSTISVSFIIFLIIIMTFITGRKVKSLPPVVAMRGGLATHNFSSNKFPLENKFGNLYVRLGLKYIFANLKQNIMICTIVTFITISCIAVLILYDSFSSNKELMYKMSGFEAADLALTLTKHTDYEEMIKNLENMSEVKKAFVSQTEMLKIEDREVLTFISSDCSKFEIIDFYDGEYPENDNEVVISGLLADTLNKKVGDEIEISMNGVCDKYIITGLTQSMNNEGLIAVMTIDGIKRLSQFYEINSLNVYLKEGTNLEYMSDKIRTIYGQTLKQSINTNDSSGKIEKAVDEKITNLLTLYGVDSVQYSVMVGDEIILSGNSEIHKVDKITNIHKIMAAQIDMYANVMRILSEVIVLVTLVIITMILYLVIKAMIIKRRKEFSIYKSIGYTNKQIMKQIVMCLIPVIILGEVSGCIIGCIAVPAFLAKCLYYLGASHAVFKINLLYTTLLCVGIVIFSYFTSILISRKIKNISVYELFTE